MPTPPSNEQLAAQLLEIVKEFHDEPFSSQRNAIYIAVKRLTEPSASQVANAYPSTPPPTQTTPLPSKAMEKALRGKTAQELDDDFRGYIANLDGSVSKCVPVSPSSNPDRVLLLAILIRSKERLAFFRKEAADETWCFRKEAQGKCDELDGIIYEIENHLKKYK